MPRAKNVAVVPVGDDLGAAGRVVGAAGAGVGWSLPTGTDGAAAGWIVVERLCPASYPQRFCLDKGYDNPSDREATEAARRWVVERTLVGLSKCRATLVRYDKNPLNYLALIQLACARLIPARRLHKIHQPDTF